MVEIQPTAADLGGKVIATNCLDTGRLRLNCGVAFGEYNDSDGFAETMRQRSGSANVLVCMTGVHTQIDGQINRSIKLGVGHFFQECHRFIK